jgi:hypothetical protein
VILRRVNRGTAGERGSTAPLSMCHNPQVSNEGKNAMPIMRAKPIRKYRGVIRRDMQQCKRYVAILLRRDNALAEGKKIMSTEDHAAFEVVENALTTYLASTV